MAKVKCPTCRKTLIRKSDNRIGDFGFFSGRIVGYCNDKCEAMKTAKKAGTIETTINFQAIDWDAFSNTMPTITFED
jgi:ssDNA-binding Zn-finger/Zn-ribbon topoisomerase 1